MDHPDFVSELHGVDHAERIARKDKAISNTPDPIPCIGFAMSALPPSAAIVRVARHIDLAPSGNVSNSFSAARIQEMGRVLGVIAAHGFLPPRRSNVVICDNPCQDSRRSNCFASVNIHNVI